MEYEIKKTVDGLFYALGEYGQTDCYEEKIDAIDAYSELAAASNPGFYDIEAYETEFIDDFIQN